MNTARSNKQMKNILSRHSQKKLLFLLLSLEYHQTQVMGASPVPLISLTALTFKENYYPKYNT